MRPLGGILSKIFDPGELELGSEFCPTLSLHCYALPTSGQDDIVAALKAKLYKPAKNPKTDLARFSLRRHGWLFELGGST